jgi:hypothetical protein
MTQLQQTILTSILTIAGAVMVFGVTQFLQRFWLDPIQEYAKVIAGIDCILLVHANVLGTPIAATDEQRSETRLALRKCAGQFLAAVNAVHWCGLARLFSLVPKDEAVQVVLRNLIGLSNVGTGSDAAEPHLNTRWAREIAKELGLRIRL